MRHSTGTNFRLVKVCLLASVIGVLAGISAELLHRMIGLVTNILFYQRLETEIVSPLASPLGAGIMFVPALGGLVIGIMAKYGSPLVRGHGIPEAMEAVLVKRSKIHPKVALLKPLSAAVALGSGQPFGAEGPIIQTGAAIGSLIGQFFQTSTAERKVLLACGSAAGLAATFGTPVAAIIFAIELLLFEFQTRSFIPLVLASSIATEVHIILLGTEPVFTVRGMPFGEPVQLLFFVLLGLICGGVSILLTRGLYWVEDHFHHLKVSHYLYPMLGGLFVGVVGYITPQLTYQGIDVFGPGYHVIENILSNQYVVGFLLVLILAKASVWLVALGSGTSGGTLAPIFMIGAGTGAILGLGLQALFPNWDISPEAFALAGMAAVFGGCTRATFASIIFAFEMTRSYEAILPVMIACVIADLIATQNLPTSILTEQLRRQGVLVNHEYQVDLLSTVSVGEVMNPQIATLPHTLTVAEALQRIESDPRLTQHQGVLLVDKGQNLVGIVTHKELQQALREGSGNQTVLEAGVKRVIVATPEMSVRVAMLKMFEHEIGRLPVVTSEDSRQVVGYLSRTHVLKSYEIHLHSEHHREIGWLRQWHKYFRKTV